MEDEKKHLEMTAVKDEKKHMEMIVNTIDSLLKPIRVPILQH